MTEEAAPPPERPVSHISTLWAWLFVGLLLVAVVVGVVGQVFSRAVVLDLVSFWPFLVVIFLIAATVLPRSRGRWLASVVPLLLIGWLVTAIVLHVNGWEQLPSSSARLAGPIHVGAADLTVNVPGVLEIRGAAAQPEAYLVIPRKAGGDVGAPEALERQVDLELAVGLRPIATSQWFQSEGWDITLDDRLTWVLALTAIDISADLSSLVVSSVEVTGDGTVTLGPMAENSRSVDVRGNVTIVVPNEETVQIIGEASVPPSFTATEDGYVRGEGDPTVTIQVVAGALTVTESTQ